MKSIEVGSGCGALARIFQLVTPGASHVFVDLPESLFFAYCYVRLNFPDKKFLHILEPTELDRNANEVYDFIFVPTAFINAITPLTYDLFLNMDSFGRCRRRL